MPFYAHVLSMPLLSPPALHWRTWVTSSTGFVPDCYRTSHDILPGRRPLPATTSAAPASAPWQPWLAHTSKPPQ